MAAARGASVAVLLLGALVALAMAAAVDAGPCSLAYLEPCMAAGKGTAPPDAECCGSVKALGSGAGGVSCLCALVNSDAAKASGVVFTVAIGIPQRCGLPIPQGSTCNGMKIPGA